ncbi:MAG: universal stress protein [Rubrivivax sp.]|jgi:nucleotide-binding universal stress UspA family protein|nr:universal stress protein [Rubrivivax sp.]
MKPTAAILAATDFSPLARHAADRAARIAHECGAALTLLHVLPSAPMQALREWFGADHDPAQRVAAEAGARLDALADELAAARHVQPRRVVLEGAPIDAIGGEADTVDAGLLVVGARGEGFLRRLVLGTTAERLMRRTTRPLLVVRQPPHEPYRRVLVALDFSPWSTQAVILARRIAPHARLLLLTAYQVPFEDKLRFAGVDAATIDRYRRQAHAEATRQLHAAAADSGLRPAQWEARVVEGDASERIVRHEQEDGCDLVVVGKHGQSAAEDLLLGSTTKHVLAEGSADVLVATLARR